MAQVLLLYKVSFQTSSGIQDGRHVGGSGCEENFNTLKFSHTNCHELWSSE